MSQVRQVLPPLPTGNTGKVQGPSAEGRPTDVFPPLRWPPSPPLTPPPPTKTPTRAPHEVRPLPINIRKETPEGQGPSHTPAKGNRN